MNAAAPEGAPRGGSETKNSKNSLPAVPQRGPEAGVLRIKLDFHCFCMNSRSCLFLQSHLFVISNYLIEFMINFYLKTRNRL
jgi:hypothetical protein